MNYLTYQLKQAAINQLFTNKNLSKRPTRSD